VRPSGSHPADGDTPVIVLPAGPAAAGRVLPRSGFPVRLAVRRVPVSAGIR
jgi:hypothetical protein